MKRKILFIVLTISVFVLFGLSQTENKAFAPAEDFPRGALVYAQTSDLPGFIKLWNESEFKRKYLESRNFTDFQNNHLGKKLANRLREFNEAAGFEFNLETVSQLAENKAAIALYDIGKLEFVFIAPVREEFFVATRFMQNRENFVEETLEDGTAIYRAQVEADRGRQRQELIFTGFKGRLIIATNEKLIAQTLKNIGVKGTKNRLADEPSFRALSPKTEPRLATVWVNQNALNEDYYFRRYWLMSDVADLKNIRAGIFDLEIADGKIVERRKFLLDTAKNASSIKTETARRLLSHMPAEIPFYHLRAVNAEIAGAVVRKTIFDRREDPGKSRIRSVRYTPYEYAEADWRDYYSPDEKFDQNVNETEENEVFIENTEAADFSDLLRTANPQAVLSFTEPELQPAPRFVEFRRAAVFSLAAPGKFNQSEFESALAKVFAQKVLIAAPNAGFEWRTKSENELSWRELNLPMTAWSACYVLRGNELILTNSAELLREILASKSAEKSENFAESFDELKTVRLDQRKKAFDDIFGELSRKKIADSFFTENVASLLDAADGVKKIEVIRRHASNTLEEKVTAYLR